jgi:enoyl-CoA hydratase
MSTSGEATDDVLLAVADGVAVVTLNRPKVRNAVSTQTMGQLGDVLAQIEDDPTIRAAVLTGSGGSFCSGADLGSGVEEFADPERAVDMMEAIGRTISGLVRSRLPFIAAVEGPAAGVGASLAFACDLVVASSSSYFLLPFTGIGLIPDGGSTSTVAASIGRARAMRMALRRERLGAVDALAAGLIAAVVEPDEVAATAHAWAVELSNGPQSAVALTKALINEQTLGGLDHALDREKHVQLERLASDDFREGATAFLERRPPVYHHKAAQ